MYNLFGKEGEEMSVLILLNINSNELKKFARGYYG